MAVKISGGVLSSAVNGFLQSICDQEGLVLGDITTKIISVIDDAQIENRKECIVYEIKHMVPCHSLRKFVDKQGKVVESQLDEIVNQYSCKNVIGWYKCRQNSPHRMSFFERLTSLSLQEKFKSKHRSLPPLFALFTTQQNSNRASLIINYSFLQQTASNSIPLTLQVLNLGKTMSHYKLESHSSHNEPTYQHMLEQHGVEFDNQRSVQKVDELANDLCTELSSLCKQVQTSEEEVLTLESETDQLRRRLTELVCSNTLDNINSPSNTDEQPSTEDNHEVDLINFNDSVDETPSKPLSSAYLEPINIKQNDFQDSFEHIELPVENKTTIIGNENEANGDLKATLRATTNGNEDVIDSSPPSSPVY